MKNAGKVVVVFLVLGMAFFFLPVLVIAGASGQTNAETCTTGLQSIGNGQIGAGVGGDPVEFEGTKQGTDTQVVVPLHPQGLQKSAKWTAAQIRNAATITNVARTRKLSPRAAAIAVATAMQESSLNNLDHGDRDSVGLFQQRPGEGWGTVAQLTDPVYASTEFYDSLTKISGWQTRPLTEVAAAVQRPAEEYRGAYAKWEETAGSLVATTWGTHAFTSLSTGCNSGSGSDDPSADFKVTNPRTAAQAIAAARKAEGQTGWYRRCDNFIAQAYGWGSSGSDTANVHWNRLVDAGLAHPGDNSPPAGALLLYDTGQSAGHVALYLGNDMVASSDVLNSYKGEGLISIVHRKEMTDGAWRLRYRGWAEPSFPDAGGTSTI